MIEYAQQFIKDTTMFFGRDNLIAQLETLTQKRVASLVTCRGRRRIGKSTLIEEFARKTDSRFIKIEGKRPNGRMDNSDELESFARQLADQSDAEATPPASWPDALKRLNAQISDSERTVVLLDEISWLAYFADDFAEDLKIAWDNLFKKHDRLILVLCGSVSCWIKDNIIDNGAYMGRRSLDIVVPELSLESSVKFWGDAAPRLATREIIDVLSVVGGVPRYLEEINPAESAEQNIKRLFFMPKAVLRMDFDDMFRDVITEETNFTGQVLKALVGGPKSGAEIADELSIPRGGRVAGALSRLEESGCIAADNGTNPETGERPREKRYRIRDNYTRFYLKYVEPVKDIIDSGAFDFISLGQFENINALMGLAFENLVINNYRDLIKPLHLDGQLITSAAPYRRKATNGRNGRKGVQIDLLIQTRRSIYIVEIKRKETIDREIIQEMDARVKAIRRPDGVSIRTALVYDGNLSPVVAADGYFDAIVPFKKLLGL